MEIITLVITVAGVIIGYLQWRRPRPVPELTEGKPQSSPASVDAAVSPYLRFVQSQLRYIDFRGVVRLDRLDVKFALEDVAIEPRLTPIQSLTAISAAGWKIDTGRIAEALGERMAGRHHPSVAPSLDDLVSPRKVTVLLGDPGSGKSTALKLLALRNAARGLAETDFILPVLIPLTAYAEAIRAAGNAVPPALADFVIAYLVGTKNIDNSVGELVRTRLREGKTLFLLDGLDEVTVSSERLFLTARIEDFVRWHRESGNIFVITSRIVGYSEMPISLNSVEHLLLADFDDDEISEFIDKWSRVAEQIVADLAETVTASAAVAEAAAVKRAVLSNPGVRRLAANPLLLTVLVFIHRQGMELPQRRAELYELYVKTLINSWSRARNLDGRPIQPLDETEVTKVLAPVAYWLHSTFPAGHCGRGQFVGVVQNSYRTLRGLDPTAAEAKAADLVEALVRFAGLLAERGTEEIAFSHLTFEEYLAARHIVLEGQLDKRRCVELLLPHVNEPAWREVSNLVVGYIGIVAKEELSAALIVLELAGSVPPRGEPERFLWACEAAADCGRDGLPVETWDRLRLAAREVASHSAELRNRWRAGTVCSLMGDPIIDDQLSPEMIDIPEGYVLQGSRSDLIAERMGEIGGVELSPENEWVREYWQATLRSEEPQQVVHVQAFRVSRFPVTCAQYATFLAANPTVPAPSAVNDKSDPFGWDPLLRTPPSGRENQPVVLVSWEDAVKYCEWLSAVTGGVFRLPTDSEWEYAARGTDGRIFPWGNEWSPQFANTLEEGAHDIVAVGLYPEGASVFGVEDCVGQVWEWTSSSWGMDWRAREVVMDEKLSQSFPWVIVRGGSWDDLRIFANCASRGPNLKSFRAHYVGFRIIEVL